MPLTVFVYVLIPRIRKGMINPVEHIFIIFTADSRNQRSANKALHEYIVSGATCFSLKSRILILHCVILSWGDQ